MEAKKKRLTLDLDPAFQRRLKVIAALKGVSMRLYCRTAIDRELTKDEANGLTGLPSSLSDAERFEALQEKYFGDRALSGSGADYIREARETRDAQIYVMAVAGDPRIQGCRYKVDSFTHC